MDEDVFSKFHRHEASEPVGPDAANAVLAEAAAEIYADSSDGRRGTSGDSNIRTGGSSGKYVAGDDTNIVFTEKEDDEGNATGEIAVDVYYK